MKFLNIHIIQSVPYSNMNRDDAGSPKTALIGGALRARLSSQSQRRAQRLALEAVSSADRTSRSKLNANEAARITEELLAAAGHQVSSEERADIAAKAKSEINKLVKKPAKDGAKDKKDTLVWLAEDEIRQAAANIAASVTGAELTPFLTTKTTNSLTIAAFGRMFAAAPQVQTEAAVQVAHALTTHEATLEVDYFTAVDDLRMSIEGDAGSGHLDLAEYTSGVFYRYCNVDRDQLVRNWTGASDTDAATRLAELFSALVLSLPSGKANTTAPHTLPLLVVVEESRQPLSFAPAFEKPVQANADGFAAPSVAAFHAYAQQARKMAPHLFGARRVTGTAGEFDDTLHDLISFAGGWVLGNR